MESKIKNYLDQYEVYETLCNKNAEIAETVRKLETEISDLEKRRGQVDFTDAGIMADSMEAFVKKDLAEKESLFKNQASEETGRLKNVSGKAAQNIESIIRRMGRDKADRVALSKPLDVSAQVDPALAEDASAFTTLSGIDAVFGKVFRLGPSKWPGLIRGIVGFTIWWMISAFLSDAVSPFMTSLFYIGFIVNVVVYLLADSQANNWLRKNSAVYLAYTAPDKLRTIWYESLIGDYKSHNTDVWMSQIESIRKNGLTSEIENDPDSIYNFIRRKLSSSYTEYGETADIKRKEIIELSNEKENNEAKVKTLIPDLLDAASQLETLVTESGYNEGVLSPFVKIGFSGEDANGIRKLINIKHDGKPVIICYTEQTHKNGEKFRETAADLVERLMMGFYYENYYDNISMSLVDFEGLYFPESRTQGLMNVIRSRDALSKLFDNIKDVRKAADSQADGKLSTINPIRLKNRENPIKYNVVYFVGNDFSSIDIEINQLFIGGESFGFVPVIFMKEDDIRAMLKDNSQNRNFASVVRKINDAEQVYSMEGILSAIN